MEEDKEDKVRDGRDDAFIGYEGVVGSISVQFGEEMGKRNQSWLTCFCLSFRSLGFVASFFVFMSSTSY